MSVPFLGFRKSYFKVGSLWIWLFVINELLRSNNYRTFFTWYFLSFLSLEYYRSCLVFHLKKVWYLQMKFHNNHLLTIICKQISNWLKLCHGIVFCKKISFSCDRSIYKAKFFLILTRLAITPRGMVWKTLRWMDRGMQRGNAYRISFNILRGNIPCNIC